MWNVIQKQCRNKHDTDTHTQTLNCFLHNHRIIKDNLKILFVTLDTHTHTHKMAVIYILYIYLYIYIYM